MDYRLSYDRSEVLRRHMVARSWHEQNAVSAENITQMVISNMNDAPNSQLANVEITETNRITLDEIIEEGPESVHPGTFLLCRSIAPSWRINSVNLVVDDPDSDHVVTLAVYNIDQHPTLSNGKVPVGCIFALMNPWLKVSMAGHSAVRCDNPRQFVVIEQSHAILRGVTWRNPLPFPTEIEPESPAETFRSQGNKHFSDQKYEEAIACYSESIRLDPRNAILFSNRAACYLALEKFQLALEDAENGLQVDAGNVKLIYRKAKALFELKRYHDCADFLKKTKANVVQNTPELGEICEKSNRFHVESTEGKYPVAKMYKDARKDPILDHAEFARFDLVQVGPGKCAQFGIIAKKDIPAGTLIFVSKAIVYHAKSVQNSETVDMIAKRIKVDPALKEDFLKIRTKDPIQDESTEAQIRKIVELKMNCERISNGRDVAVWLYPTLMNHTCVDANCFRFIIGNFMFVRLIKAVAKGEELLVCYVANFLDIAFETRDQDLRVGCGYVCNCRLCVLESADSPEKRAQVVENARKIKKLYDTTKKPALSEIESLLAEARSLRRPDEQVLNGNALIVANFLARAYFENGQKEKAVKLLDDATGKLENIGAFNYVFHNLQEMMEYFEPQSKWRTRQRDLARLLLGTETLLPYWIETNSQQH